MEDLIKQIVDMDRKAREITDAAQMEKVNSEKEVAARREQIRNDYLERARRRIALNEPKERAVAEEEWKEKEKKNKVLFEKLDKLYAENGDKWVREIVERVLGSDGNGFQPRRQRHFGECARTVRQTPDDGKLQRPAGLPQCERGCCLFKNKNRL